MGRNNSDFQESALYHGSEHPFEPGDVVKPNKYLGGVAFATPSMEGAAVFGRGHVFQVEALGKTETQYSDTPVPFVTSTDGFKVIKKVREGLQ